MSNELIPERRVNKLGHIVTKHVKAPRGDSAKNAKLPMVLLPVDREKKIAVIAEQLDSRYAKIAVSTSSETPTVKERIESAMRELSDLTLDRLEGVRLIGRGVVARMLLEKEDEYTINDFIAVADEMERSVMPKSQIEQYLRSLRLTSELCPQGENGEYPAERGEQCLALVKVMKYMEDRQFYRLFIRDKMYRVEYPYISDDKLRQLVINAGADREAVVNLIIDRGLLDADHIQELVRGTHSSLLEGTL